MKAFKLTIPLLLIALPALAQVQVGTVRRLPLENETSACIDGSAQTATIFVKSYHEKRLKSWFRQDTTIGIKVDVIVASETNVLNYPVAKKTSIQELPGTLLRLFQNLKLVNRMSLKDEKGNVLQTVSFPFQFVHERGDTLLSTMLNDLADVTASNSTISSLIGATGTGAIAVKAFSGFVDGINKVAKQQNPDEVAEAIFFPEFSVSPDASCGGTNPNAPGIFLRDGLVALASDTDVGTEADGVISLSNIDTRCFYSSGGDDPDIYFSSRSAGQKCPSVIPDAPKVLHNRQVLFVVIAGTGRTAPPAAETKEIARAATGIARNSLAEIAKNFGLTANSLRETGNALTAPSARPVRINPRPVAALRAAQLCDRYKISPADCQ
jgi:hypothetical protein